MVVEEADWCSRVGASLFNLVCVDGSPSVVSVRRFSRGSILKPMILDNESTLLLLLMLMLMLIKFDFSMYGGRGGHCGGDFRQSSVFSRHWSRSMCALLSYTIYENTVIMFLIV